MKIEALAQKRLDSKTKPLGSLGQLEALAVQLCAIQNSLHPMLSRPIALVFAGDHGIVNNAPVSAYPQSVTLEMVRNFLSGGAAISVLCQQHSLDLQVIDCGIAADLPQDWDVLPYKLGYGTEDYRFAPAITQSQWEQSQAHAKQLVAALVAEGRNTLILGEMGIGNTSASALLLHALSDLPLQACVGNGTGLTDSQWQEKCRVLEQAIARTGRNLSAEHALLEFGGFEIASLVATIIEASKHSMVLVIDGFIASTAALVATQLAPNSRANMVFSHVGAEAGHQHVLALLQAEPLLRLDMRLGEASGAALAYPLLESAVRLLSDMASFEEAQVSSSCLESA